MEDVLHVFAFVLRTCDTNFETGKLAETPKTKY